MSHSPKSVDHQIFFSFMSSIPPGSSPLRLPLGEIVYYSTGRPSIRTLTREIAALGYEVSGFPLRHTTSGPLLWGSGIGLWSSAILSYLLSLPRRSLRRICLRTRAATNHPTSSPTRITSIRIFLRTGTGTVEICSPSQTAPGSRARDKIKIGDPRRGATGG